MTSHDTAGRLFVRQSDPSAAVGSTRRRNPRGTVAARALAIGAATLIWLAAMAGAVSADPPGNNGTIKVDAAPFDTHPNNEPHVGCVFQVDFYGFDQGDLWADVIFEAHPPTGRGVLQPTRGSSRVFIGEDDNSGGGSQAGLDAQETYDLSAALQAYTPHPQQGYHVKLTIHADGSQGADTKHKVFWVAECAVPSAPTPTPTPSPTPTPTPPGGGGTSGATPTPTPTPPIRGGTLPSQGGPGGGILPNTAVTVPVSAPALVVLALCAVGAASLAVATTRASRDR